MEKIKLNIWQSRGWCQGSREHAERGMGRGQEGSATLAIVGVRDKVKLLNWRLLAISEHANRQRQRRWGWTEGWDRMERNGTESKGITDRANSGERMQTGEKRCTKATTKLLPLIRTAAATTGRMLQSNAPDSKILFAQCWKTATNTLTICQLAKLLCHAVISHS